MPESKNILQVAPKVPSWGFDLFQQIDAAYASAGHHITTVFLRGNKDQKVANSYHGNIIFLELNRKHINWRFKALKDIYSICRKRKYDLAIAHHYKPTAILGLIDRIIPIAKLFMVNHNAGNYRRKGRRFIITHLLSNRWKFITVSNWVRTDILNSLPGINPDRVFTIYNCLDIDEVVNQIMPQHESRNFLGLESGDFIFGTIGRLDSCKNHELLIQAFAQIAIDIPELHLIIIGGGENITSLENLASNLGVSKRVHLPGLIPQAYKYVSAFDAFVLPSVREGFGLVLLEAMSARVPTITSMGAAMPEVVGDTGLQFPPGDTDALAQRLFEVYSMSAEERKRLGADAFKRLSSRFSKERYHQDFLALLE